MQSKKGKLSPQKAAKTPKQIAAATKTILNFEKAQAYKNRVSDNLEVFFLGLVAGASLLYIIHVLSV